MYRLRIKLLCFLSFASYYALQISFKSSDAFCSTLTMPVSKSMRKKWEIPKRSQSRIPPTHLTQSVYLPNVWYPIRSRYEAMMVAWFSFRRIESTLSFYFLNSFVYTFSVRVMFSCSIPANQRVKVFANHTYQNIQLVVTGEADAAFGRLGWSLWVIIPCRH